MKTFETTPMVQFNYSFPDVDEATQKRINVILNRREFAGTIIHHDGRQNSGTMYLTAQNAELLKETLRLEGFVDVEEYKQTRPDRYGSPFPTPAQVKKIMVLNAIKELTQENGRCAFNIHTIVEKSGVPKAELWNHNDFTGILAELSNDGQIVIENRGRNPDVSLDSSVLC